ncbi:MAG: AAA family ATPase [Firmicutes bacterium]|nr:AAA family ATPase [Bacillota bacterium]
MTRQEITDNIDLLLEVLPPRLRGGIEALDDLNDLVEVILDLGRQPEARFAGRFIYLSEEPVSREDIGYVLKRVGRFGGDNRAGIERTLHRISAIRNRTGEIIGLTCRVGRAVFGTIDIIRDVVEQEKSLLLLGRPGVGKTTMLREVARVLSDEFEKRVVVVDTSNEIAGDGDIPHPGIGRSRRMQVPTPAKQADVMIEAVENHMPEVIVIDEIGTEAEADAARTIAERGVQLIGTAHGDTLTNLVLNPVLSDLVGGIQAVTLGDEEARKRGTQKTVLERKAPPTFDVVIEIKDRDTLAIHHDVARTVDLLLRGIEPRPEIRVRGSGGEIKIVQEAGFPGAMDRMGPGEIEPGRGGAQGAIQGPTEEQPRFLRIFPYAVSHNKLSEAIEASGVRAYIARDIDSADVILTLRGQYRKMPKRLREAAERGLPIHIIKSNTISQILGFLRQRCGSGGGGSGEGVTPGARPEEGALREAEEAALRVSRHAQPVELRPQNAYIRRLQHELASRKSLQSVSIGVEPNRRVVIFSK